MGDEQRLRTAVVRQEPHTMRTILIGVALAHYVLNLLLCEREFEPLQLLLQIIRVQLPILVWLCCASTRGGRSYGTIGCMEPLKQRRIGVQIHELFSTFMKV